MIAFSKADHTLFLRERDMEILMNRLINWMETKKGKCILGVSGHGAAGKTSFTNKLLERLGSEEINYMNTDPYIVSSNIRRNSALNYTYENVDHRYKMTACHPAAHHLGSLERDIRMVRNGLDFYTIDAHYAKSKLVSSQKQITIVEGMSTAFINPQLFDLTIYFYTDSETELKRRSSRDVIERGADLAYLKQSHDERRIQYELFMHSYSENFDIVIKSIGNEQIVEKTDFHFNK